MDIGAILHLRTSLRGNSVDPVGEVTKQFINRSKISFELMKWIEFFGSTVVARADLCLCFEVLNGFL